MKPKLLINRLIMSAFGTIGYMVIFISMVNLKICSYNKPISSMPCYLCFWGIFLAYYFLIGSCKMNSIELVRYGSVQNYILHKLKLTTYNSLVYCTVFTISIYTYSYISLKIVNIKNIAVFFITIFFAVFLMSYIVLIVYIYCGEKAAAVFALLMVLISAVPELSFFISVRLEMADNYYIKPMMIITKSQSNINIFKDLIPVIAVWTVITSIFGILMKKARKTVYCYD